MNDNVWFMAGTEETGEYIVLASSSFGRVGYRLINGWGRSAVRIRVEPASPAHADKIAKVLTADAGWKQPGDNGQDRFSIVHPLGAEALGDLEQAFRLIKRGRPLVYNPDKLDYATDLSA